MRIISSPGSRTNKYIHSDGSETAIKRHLSGEFDARGEPVFKDNNKYSIVASCSTGCQMNCNFCHLTIKKATFKPSNLDRLVHNIKSAILHEFKLNPDIADKNIKLCWMGMGEALTSLRDVSFATTIILNWAVTKGYAKGIEGVDISTVLPKLPDKWMKQLSALNHQLEVFFDNTELRLFYSLHSVDQKVRDKIIPNAMALNKAIPRLKELHNTTGIPIILHYMFMEGINDSEEQVEDLSKFIKDKGLGDFQLRILRYNSADPDIKESPELFDLLKKVPHNKVQFSAGTDILSACGQFVVEHD